MTGNTNKKHKRRQIYICPVCGIEVIVLSKVYGKFRPSCCNMAMEKNDRKIFFYYCSVCGVEISVLNGERDSFVPNCCSTDMILTKA